MDVTDDVVINERIQLHRTDLQEVLGLIRIKLKKLVSRQIVPPPSKLPSRTPLVSTEYST